MPLEYATASSTDDEEIGALCQKCLNTPAEYFVTRLRNDPTLGPNARVVARDGGKIVANVNFFSLQLAFGAAQIGAGGIANVSTDPEYRGKGAATKLMEDSHRLMLEEGIPVAILGTGIQPFYERMGYAVWERTETRLLSLKVPPARASAKTVDLKRDLSALTEIKAAERESFLGCLVRPKELWAAQSSWSKWFPAEDPSLALLERGGHAYLRMALEADKTTAVVLDFGVQSGRAGAVRSLASAAGGELCSRGVKAVRLPEPCRDLAEALGEHAKAREPKTNTTLMLKILNLRGFLDALRPELEKRAAAARLTEGSVGLKHGTEGVTIRLSAGAVEIAEGVSAAEPFAALEPARWLEVFMGVKRFSSQPFARTSRAGEKEINLLEALFPRRDGVFWEADAF